MFQYILSDIRSVLHFWPYGVAAGIFVLMFLLFANYVRGRRGKGKLAVTGTVFFYMYLAIIFAITFFSRENGAGRVMDLELFSSWGINDRNNAYVVENVLLFVPYGIFCAWYLAGSAGFLKNGAIGLFTSVLVECLQLFTGRGVFQIDDILTNCLGSVIGYCIFCIVAAILSRKQRKGRGEA